MVLYKIDDSGVDYSVSWSNSTYGYIGLKKIDDYNEPLKVFIPIARREYMVWFHGKKDPREINIINHDGSEWKHLSEIEELLSVSKKDLKEIKTSLRRVVKERRTEFVNLETVYESL